MKFANRRVWPVCWPSFIGYFSLVLDRLHNRTGRSSIQSIQNGHIFFRYFKIINVGITPDPAWVVALGQRYPALLQRISNQNLSRRLSVFICDTDQRGLTCFIVSNEGCIGLDDNTVGSAVRSNDSLLAPRVELSIKIKNS